MKKIHCASYRDPERAAAGDRYGRFEEVLISPEITEACVGASVRMKEGFRTEPHTHEDEEQVFVVLEGAGRLRSGQDTFELSRGTIVYIPRGTLHEITALAGGLGYVYLTVWPEGKPPGVKPRVETEADVVNIYYE